METSESFDVVFKIVVVGDSGVGKTNLLSRFTQNEFDSGSKATIGVEFATKTVTVDGVSVKAQIWDTAGQEKYRAITSVYYRGSAAALIVYDVTNADSFANITKAEKGWLQELRNNTDEEMPIMIVGNKSDLCLCRCVSMEEASEFAVDQKLDVIETSARDDVNVDEAFQRLIQRAYEKMKAERGDDDDVDDNNNEAQPRQPKTPNGPNSSKRVETEVVRLQGQNGKKKIKIKKKCC